MTNVTPTRPGRRPPPRAHTRPRPRHARRHRPAATPVRVAVASQKGGVGKTTITLGLAATAAAAGIQALVVDTDPQASAYDLTQALDDPGWEVVHDTDPAHLAKLGEARHRLILVDAPGNLGDTAVLDMILASADLVIIPSDLDVTSIGPTLATVRFVAARSRDALVLLNALDPRVPKLEADARDALTRLELPAFRAAVRSYRAWPNSLRDGVPITRYPGPYAARARLDILQVFNELLARVSRLTGRR